MEWALQPGNRRAVRPKAYSNTAAPPRPSGLLGRLGLGLRHGGLEQLTLELGWRRLEARDSTQQAGERGAERRHLYRGVLEQQPSREGRADAADGLDGVAQPGGEPRLRLGLGLGLGSGLGLGLGLGLGAGAGAGVAGRGRGS